jgi:hypothetical protein
VPSNPNIVISSRVTYHNHRLAYFLHSIQKIRIPPIIPTVVRNSVMMRYSRATGRANSNGSDSKAASRPLFQTRTTSLIARLMESPKS